MPEARRLILNPADTSQGYIVWSHGLLQPFGGAPPTDATERWNNRVWDAQVIDFLTPSGFVLTDDGVVRGFGGAPNVNDGAIAAPYYRFLSMNPDGSGQGVILQLGGIWDAIGGGPGLAVSPPTFAYDAVRGWEHDWASGDWLMVLRHGGLHSSTGIAGSTVVVKPGRDVYRGLVAREWDATPAFWVVDYAGSIFVGNGAEPTPTTIAPFLGRDVVRDIRVVSDGTGGDPLELRLLTSSGGFKRILVSGPPEVDVTGPGSPVTDSTRPTITWDFTDPDGDDQKAYDVKLFSSAQYGVGDFDPETSEYTERFNRQDRTTFEVRPAEDLGNGNWRAYARARDTSGKLSEWDFRQWTQSVTLPDAPDLAAIEMLAPYWSVQLNVTGAVADEEVDLRFTDDPPSADERTWYDVRAGASPRVANGGGAYDGLDTEPPLNQTRYYRARARSGDGTVAGDWSAEVEVTLAEPSTWVLSDPEAVTWNTPDPETYIRPFEVVPPFGLQRALAAGIHRPAGRAGAIRVFSQVNSRQGPVRFRTRTNAEYGLILDLFEAGRTLLLRSPVGHHVFIGLAETIDYEYLRSRSGAASGVVMGQVNEHSITVVEVDRPDVVLT